MTYETIIYEEDAPIGTITLNRPEVLNAIDHEVPGLLSQAVAAGAVLNSLPWARAPASASLRVADHA